MSKLKFLFLLCLLTYSISASADETITITTYYPSPNGSYNQLSTTGNTYLATVSGNVGIGTTAPATKLEVVGASGDETQRWTYAGEPSVYNLRLKQVVTAANVRWVFDQKENQGLIDSVLVFAEGNVGIGTTDPGYKLDVKGITHTAYPSVSSANPIDTGLKMHDSYIVHGMDGTSIGGITLSHQDYGNYDIRLGKNTIGQSLYGNGSNFTSQMVVKNNGNVGIGTTNPAYQLQLSTDSAAKPGTNTWTIASDKRLKKDIRPYTNGLEIIKKIKPVWFKYNGKAGFPQDNQDHIGVIGQEIIKVAPYTVNTFKARLSPDDKKETELLNFNSHALTFDLINAVKELDAKIAKLTQENQELKKELSLLKSRPK